MVERIKSDIRSKEVVQKHSQSVDVKESKMFKNKFVAFVFKVLGGIFAVGLLIVAVFLLNNVLTSRTAVQTGQSPTPTVELNEKVYLPIVTKGDDQPSPTPDPDDPTAGWLTYTDDVAGFSFKYPKDWNYLSPNGGMPGAGVTLNPSDHAYYYYQGISIRVEKNSQQVSTRDAMTSRIQKLGSVVLSGKDKEVQQITIGELSGSWLYDPYSGTLVEAFFSHPQGDYIIHASLIEGGTISAQDPDKPEVQEDLKVFKLLLESFEFIEK